jgi:hypothetical protein
VSELRPELPRALDAVIATALAKRPDDRYSGAGAFVQDLGDALGSAPDQATRAAPVPPPRATSVPTREHATEVLPRPVRGRRRWLTWIALAALAVLLVVAAVVLVTTRGSSGADEHAAELGTFLDRMGNVLDQSAAGRREIQDALSSGLGCSITPAEAARRIASVADNRQSILEQLGSIPAPTPEAAQLVTLLQRALQESIEADRHYRDGFLALGPDATCPLTKGRDFALAAAADRRATAAKVRFASAFNELASRYGRPAWSPGDF